MTPAPVQHVYEALHAAYGPRGWWPAESRDEMIIGAILVQQTAWRNVVKALANLDARGINTLETIHRADPDELEACIRPAGFYRVKTRRLKHFARWLADAWGGSLDRLLQNETDILRQALLSVHGIGEETADCILLYTAERPVFVIDAYTRRIWERHGWASGKESYAQLARMIGGALDPDVRVFNEYHALLVEVGKRHCGARPDCAACPLRHFLPPGQRPKSR